MFAVVLVREDWGLYLGNCMGFGFWTGMDTVGQVEAVVFPTEAAAREHVMLWDPPADPEEFEYVEVVVAHPNYATIEELEKAGLGEHLTEMRANRMMQLEPVGSA